LNHQLCFMYRGFYTDILTNRTRILHDVLFYLHIHPADRHDGVLGGPSGEWSVYHLWAAWVYSACVDSAGRGGSCHVRLFPSFIGLTLTTFYRLPLHQFITYDAGDVWFAGSIMGGLMLFGLAVFFFFFSMVPWGFKVSKRLHHVLGRTSVELFISEKRFTDHSLYTYSMGPYVPQRRLDPHPPRPRQRLPTPRFHDPPHRLLLRPRPRLGRPLLFDDRGLFERVHFEFEAGGCIGGFDFFV